ncbi:FtsX-like permease family protein [uncultured Slackia sp.]|uniref:ABC transporter permease n=1 Tax=uncultured Slackia sp. TaxID=665903 RepID=UPI0025DA2C20|nr:FtsX-like permease family protein [uncultured Slackia sp.]
MKSAFNKGVLRSITHSLGRFLAIAVIAALGTGFYAGLRMTAPDMKLAGDMYYDGSNLCDLRVMSTLGLSDENIEELRQVEGVEGVEGAWEVDALALVESTQYTVRIHSLDVDAAQASDTSDGVNAVSDDADYINRPLLIEGEWPDEPGECVVSADAVTDSTIEIGDTVQLLEGTQDLGDTLDADQFTVVGFVRSSYYASSTSMGSTSLGSGALDQFMFINEEDFADDLPYTEAFITVAGAKDLHASSAAYDDAVAAVAKRIEDLGPELCAQRLDEVKGDAQATLDESRAEYEAEKADAEAQIADGQKELDDAKAQLDDAAKEIEDGQAQIDDGWAQLNEGAAQLPSAKEQLDASAATIADSEAQLNVGQKEYEDGLAQFEQQKADAYAQLDAGQAEIDKNRETAQATIDDLQSKLDAAQSGLAAIDAQVPDMDGAISQAQAGVDTAQGYVEQAQAAFNAAQAAVDAADPESEEYAGLVAARDEAQGALSAANTGLQTAQGALQQLQGLKTQREELAAAISQLQGGIVQAQAGLDQIDAAQAELDSQRAAADEQFAQAQETLDASKAQLDDGWAQLESGKQAYADGLAQYQDGVAQYESGKVTLEASEEELAQGRAEYEDGLAEYKDGVKEFEEQKAQADEEFADAEAQLADAQAEIDDIESPEWYVLDRSKIMGAESFESDANRIDQIAQVFPFIFFLVAALVSLTTMTRMVEEERVLIGTYKALGYSNARITSKYLLYAFVASGVGSLIGIVALSMFLPYFIMEAYAIVYAVPPRPVPIDPAIALSAAGLGIGITLVATWAAAASTLRETPAALMLPRAPKAGKRILLERIKPLWSRMSFSWKVTARNIFRYKRRFFMAIIGIAGCTALLLTGLGLQNAINDIIDKQFGEIYHYNMTVRLDDGVSDEDARAVSDVLDDTSQVSEHTSARTANMIARSDSQDEGAADQRFELVVPEDAQKMSEYVTMRERVGHAALTLSEDGVIVSEKLATELGVSAGDTIRIYEEDSIGNAEGDGFEVSVAGIMENYVSQYVFMSSELYEKTFGETPEFSTVYAVATDDLSVREQMSDDLLAIDSVKTVGYNDETIDSYRTMLKSVDSVVVVLIIAAAALAFVVLYNLTNINITERAREIATLKVLGFTPHEVNAYIYRETILLSIIGALVGCVLGIWMEGFVVVTAEVDQVMFGREIHALSFVIAFALTMVFSVIVTIAMRRKLAKIDMVESLKSVE